jgi:formylglycine-generating enzyme required for sulfatase activity
MHGNVFEWCWDLYNQNENRKEKQTNPTGPKIGMWLVDRGGSWAGGAKAARSAARGCAAIFCRSDDIGFRLAVNS